MDQVEVLERFPWVEAEPHFLGQTLLPLVPDSTMFADDDRKPLWIYDEMASARTRAEDNREIALVLQKRIERLTEVMRWYALTENAKATAVVPWHDQENANPLADINALVSSMPTTNVTIYVNTWTGTTMSLRSHEEIFEPASRVEWYDAGHKSLISGVLKYIPNGYVVAVADTDPVGVVVEARTTLDVFHLETDRLIRQFEQGPLSALVSWNSNRYVAATARRLAVISGKYRVKSLVVG